MEDVEFNGEVQPPRPDRIGEEWQARHSAGDTATAYTSWTTDRSIAVDASEASSADARLSGQTRIFRVRTSGLDLSRVVFQGRDDEEEFLIERTVENVEFSDESTDDDDE